ncbi:MAG: hypothetical protein IJ012_01670, partial [Clostridia bacterium]|nr:hypothetical protein [Clostridia bacterium]
TKIADVKVTFSDDISIATAPTYNDDGSQKTPGNGAGVNAAQGYGQAKAPTTAGAAVGGLEGNCFTNAANTFWVRAASSSTSSVQGGSFAYTAPRAGTLKLTADYVDFWGNAYAHGQVAGQSAQWALFVNGVRMTDFAVVDNGEMGDNYKTDAAASINTALATAGLDTMTVNEGDLVEIVVIRPTSNTGYHVKMGLTATLTPEIGVAANLVIDDSYAMNLFVQPVDPKAAEAGVIVKNDDGTTTKLAGAKQADGTFMVTVADEIPVYELAGMTDDTGSEPDYAGVTVNYVPYEIGGSYTEGADMSSNTLSLLNAYMASENEKVATLAEAVRALAVASRNAIKKTGGVGNGVKAFLKGSYTISDNYLSGANDMELAALKKLTVPGYTFTWGTASFDDATINIDTTGYEAVKYGWAEGVDPTDAASYAYTVAAANVDLGDKISMIFLVAANGENDIYALKNGYRLKISGADQDYYGDFYSYELNGKTYMAVTVDVPVKYYATDLTVTVVNAEGTAVSADMTYSVKAWCVRNYEFGAKGSNAIQYTLKAVYLLGKAAAAYAEN